MNLMWIRYYTAHIMIGTPPKEFALVVDTGSTVTFVPCSTCQHCGSHHQVCHNSC